MTTTQLLQYYYITTAPCYIGHPEEEATRQMIIEDFDVVKEISDGKEQKRQIIPKGEASKEDENKETMKSLLGRSPDFGDGLMMRMYFEVVRVPEPGIRLL